MCIHVLNDFVLIGKIDGDKDLYIYVFIFLHTRIGTHILVYICMCIHVPNDFVWIGKIDGDKDAKDKSEKPGKEKVESNSMPKWDAVLASFEALDRCRSPNRSIESDHMVSWDHFRKVCDI